MQLSARLISPAIVAVLGVCAFFLALPSTTAVADHSNDHDTRYPPGCETWAPGSWRDNCYLGEDNTTYDRWGNYTKGVQYILWTQQNQFLAIDGNFGSGTASEVRIYQRDHGLTQDGIVGVNTWRQLRGELAHAYDGVAYHYYYVLGDDGRFDYFAFKFQHDENRFYAREIGFGDFARFNRHGPV